LKQGTLYLRVLFWDTQRFGVHSIFFVLVGAQAQNKRFVDGGLTTSQSVNASTGETGEMGGKLFWCSFQFPLSGVVAANNECAFRGRGK